MSAGRLLREARQAQGLHIAALASAIKVSPRKLELLEADRHDELPDATFIRALAQTVCRSLKIDAAPILALLPPTGGYRLEHVGEGLNTPFQERPSHLASNDWTSLAKPAVWGPALVLLAAAGVYLVPTGWLPGTDRPVIAPAASAVSALAAAARASVPASAAHAALNSDRPASTAVSAAVLASDSATEAPTPSSVPPTSVAVSAVDSAPEPASAGVASPIAKTLQLRTTADSWIQAVDANGRPMLSRLVKPGETLELDGTLPIRLTIGNASGTEVVIAGQPMALAPYSRDNIARVELK